MDTITRQYELGSETLSVSVGDGEPEIDRAIWLRVHCLLGEPLIYAKVVSFLASLVGTGSLDPDDEALFSMVEDRESLT